VNGDLAGNLVGRMSAKLSSETMTARRPRTAQTVQDRRRPRVTWERHPAVATSRERCGDRGTGTVKVTGSYEGSLSVEGIPGHCEVSPVMGWCGAWPRRLPPAPTCTRRRAKRGGRGRGDRNARGSIAASAMGRQSPCPDLGKPEWWGSRLNVDPPKRWGRHETPSPPVMLRGGQDSAKPPCTERCRSEPGTREMRVHEVVRMADVGRTHRASSLLGGRKASWRTRALAGRKPQAPHDVEHRWREGETVRGSHVSN